MLKQYRKAEYKDDNTVILKIEKIQGRRLRSNEIIRILNALQVIDTLLQYPHMDYSDLEHELGYSTSAIGRYLNDSFLLKEIYIPETKKIIEQTIKEHKLEGNRKGALVSKPLAESIVLAIAKDYLYTNLSLSKLADKYAISTTRIYRILKGQVVTRLLGEEIHILIIDKLKQNNFDNKYLEKQSLFTETKETSKPCVADDLPMFAKRAEVQTRTAYENYGSPRVSPEEVIRYRIGKSVEQYADLLIHDKDSYGSLCEKYGMTKSELSELFTSVLANFNFNKYQLLLMKYPDLRKYEETIFLLKTNKK